MNRNIELISIVLLGLAAAACNAPAPGTETDSGTDSQTEDGESSGSTSSGDPSETSGDPSDSGANTDLPSETDSDSGSDSDTDGPNLCDDSDAFVNPGAGEPGHSTIAHWKYDRGYALTINFDDSTPGQAQIGVPAMIQRGLTGTWFVNPGVDSYQNHIDTWEELAPDNFQELANHSMDHNGATDYADAEYQIGEAAALIRSVYPPERSPMMAFNRGGDTTWQITDAQMAQLLDEFDCVERVNSSGIYPATPGTTMYNQLLGYMQAHTPADDWTRIHFHGICDPSDVVNCVCNTPNDSSNCREYGNGVNNGAVSSTDFFYLLDQLVSDSFFVDQVWIAGFISAHKYQQAREVSEAVLAANDGASLSLCLTSELDPALYDEELTIITEIPGDWTGCTVSQSGQTGDCRVVDNTAQFEARIDAGPIVLSAE